MTTEKQRTRESVEVKSLADLKRLIQPGTELMATSHKNHPGIVGLVRVVTEVQSNAFYSVVKDQPEHRFSACNYRKGFRSDFEKAGYYVFNGSSIQVLDSRAKDGSVLYEFEIYSSENTMTENEQEEPDMNEYERLRRQAERYGNLYPPGTRVLLLNMNDPYDPVPSGTRGTVEHIDSMAQIHMKWDNGRTLPLNIDEDSFRTLTAEELAEEQDETMDEDDAPVMRM